MDILRLSPQQQSIFYNAVWQLVRQVTAGKVITYGQVAERIPAPEGISAEEHRIYRARWVGQAMAACPEDVPWQRVINSEGKISPRPGAEQQRLLLEAEGVEFDARGRVDLARFGWGNMQDSLF